MRDLNHPAGVEGATMTGPSPDSNEQGPRRGRGLLFCGDPHGRFDHIVRAAISWPDVPVILLGGLEPERPLIDLLEPVWERTWLIHGNHDTDAQSVAERVWDPAVIGRHLHGRVVELPDGLSIAGLGGVFRGGVWYPDPESPLRGQPRFDSRAACMRSTPRHQRWRGDVALRHWSSIHHDEWLALRGMRCDVLVLHEAPGYHPHGVPVLDELARDMGARLVVHGHHHDALDSSGRWAAQGFRSFGVGRRGVTWIYPDTGESQVVVAGEPEQSQAGR